MVSERRLFGLWALCFLAVTLAAVALAIIDLSVIWIAVLAASVTFIYWVLVVSVRWFIGRGHSKWHPGKIFLFWGLILSASYLTLEAGGPGFFLFGVPPLWIGGFVMTWTYLSDRERPRISDR
jgi:hypothetical protein